MQNRRAVLAALGSASAFGVAGCIGGSGEEAESIDFTQIQEIPTDNYEDELNIWNWYVNWAEWVEEQFNDEYPDVETTNTGYSSPTEWFSDLQAGNHEVDNVSTTAEWTQRSIDEDLIEVLPVDSMPRWDDIDEDTKSTVESHFSTEEGVYGIPHSTMVSPALGYNTDHFDEPPQSVDIFWDEEYEDQMMLSALTPVEICTIGALYTGQDPNDPDDFEEIREVLINQKPLNVTYGQEHESAMQMFINEDIVVGTHTSGRLNQAKFLHGANVEWVIPEEGGSILIDLLLIPKNAPNPRNSLNLIHTMLSNESFMRLAELTRYRPPIKNLEEVLGQSDELSEEFIETISWTDEQQENLQLSLPVSEEVYEMYDQIWSEVQVA